MSVNICFQHCLIHYIAKTQSMQYKIEIIADVSLCKKLSKQMIKKRQKKQKMGNNQKEL